MVDIDTKNRKIFEEIEATNERFKVIFDNAPIGISIWGTTTDKCYESNPANLKLLGRSSKELLSTPWAQYSYPDDIAPNEELLHKMARREIDTFTMEKRFFKPDGSIIWVSMTNAFYGYSSQGDHLHICMMMDITERKNAQQELRALSYHDQLTKVGNRRLFESVFEEMQDDSYLPVSIVVGDVNGLKITNDTYNHEVGDRLLKTVASVMANHFKGLGEVARIGGDEFVVILPKTDASKAAALVDELNKKLPQEEIIDSIVCSVSFGIDTRESTSQSLRDVYKSAEKKMYHSKLAEREKFREETILALIKDLDSDNSQESKLYDIITNYYNEKGKAD